VSTGAKTASAPWPTRLRFSRDKRRLALDLDNGETLEAPYELLRVESPSAEVQGHGSGQKKLVVGKRNVVIDQIERVGNYAVRLTFDDGHDTGLYTWDTLIRLARDADAHLADYQARVVEAGLSRDAP